MSERVLPDTVKPFKLARQGVRLEGVFPLGVFENVVSAVGFLHEPAVVNVAIQFEVGPGGAALVSGQVFTSLSSLCQRCLEAVTVDVCAGVKLALHEGELDENTLPEGFELIEVEGEQVSLVDLLEQELILALPIVPMHDHCEWVAVPVAQDITDEVVESLPQKESPFAGLSELLGKGGESSANDTRNTTRKK